MTAPLDNGETNGETGAACNLLVGSVFCRKFAKAFHSLTGCSLHVEHSGGVIAPGFTLADDDGRQALKSVNGFKVCGTPQRKRIGASINKPFLSAAQRQGAKQLLNCFVANLPKQIERFRLAPHSHDPQPVARAKELAHQKYHEPLTTPQVAKQVGLSLTYFCKIFKKTTGMTFQEYVSRIRVEEAKRRLLNHSLRVSEIVFNTGFESIPSFNRVFRKHTGKSPTQFRVLLTPRDGGDSSGSRRIFEK